MATVADSTELPPVHFLISNSLEVNNGTLSIAVEKCQLCGGCRRSFYCKNCVVNGEIKKSKTYGFKGTHRHSSIIQTTEQNIPTKPHADESYKEKVTKWQKLLLLRKELNERSKKASEKKIRLEEKNTEVILAKQKTETLKEAIKQANLLLKHEKTKLSELHQENKTRILKVPKREEKKKRIKQYIEKSNNYINSVSVDVQSHSQRLREVKNQHVQDLVSCIFPITEILPKSYTEHSEESTVDLLAEARHTSYIKGRWVYVGHSSELQYGVVHPSVPGNGDYSAYHLWSQANKDEANGPEAKVQKIVQGNPAYNIGAALQYTAQMVTILSFLLDANLPFRVWYSDFGDDLDEKRFQTLVFKLNSNILHLSCTQNVPIEHLNPHHTLENVLSLLRSPNLGRMGSFQVAEELMQSFEDNCPVDMTESDYLDYLDELDSGDVDWEQVPGSLPEAEMPIPGSFYSSTQVTPRSSEITASQSITGGLMSSATAAVSSLWRGWGNKPSK